MSNLWDKRFLQQAEDAAKWSKDPSSKIGAVIAEEDIPLTSACNGFPRGITDSDDRYTNRDIKYKIVQHAEVNAIYNCAREGICTKNRTMYINAFPCSNCVGAIIQAGISKVVIPQIFMTSDLYLRWKYDIDLGQQLLKEAGVEVQII